MRHARPIYLLLLWPGLSALAQYPTAQFADDDIVVSESAGSVELSVTISGPASGGLLIRTEDESALAGEDYTSLVSFLSWMGGDSNPKLVSIPILADAMSEGEESFLVTLGFGDGVDPGTPATARVRIVDSTAQPQAFFVLPDGIPQLSSGRASFAVEGGSDLALTLQLATFPQSPVAVQYVIEPGGTPQQVLFVDTQSVQITVPSPQQQSGELFVPQTARILFPSSKWEAWVIEMIYGFIEPDHTAPCSYCFVNLLLAEFSIGECDPDCALVFGGDCEEPQPKGASKTTLLRRYRDEILATTAGGQSFIDLYQTVSSAVMPALLRDPVLAFDIWRAQDPWIDGIAALLDGDGSSFLVTPQMESDLLELTNRLIAEGGPGTAAVADALAELTQQPLAGSDMTQFQARVELVGGGVPTQVRTWGALKSHY